jgi:hypothetical protein
MTGAFPRVYVPATLLETTGRLLASFAASEPTEGVVYWFGLEIGGQAVVTSLVVPDADTRFGDVVTSAEANAEALTAIVGTPLVLLGQVHSHPGRRVRHSGIDDRETFAQFPGALSVVVPHFGRQGVDLARCGVHRHFGDGYVLLRPDQVPVHLRVLPGVADFRRPRPVMHDDTEIRDAHAR